MATEMPTVRVRLALTSAPDAGARALLLGVLGDLYKSMARFDAALRAYERALALAPADASLLARLGTSLVQRGELERAGACLELGRLEMRKTEYDAARRL